MSKEIEVKVIDIDFEALEKELLKNGAKKVLDATLLGEIFDIGEDSTDNYKKILRLRTEGDKTVLCFKDTISKINSKQMDEFEVEVSDYNNTKEIIHRLGFKTRRTFEKKRVSYKFKDVRFDFDQYVNFPRYMEMEAKNEESIFKIAQELKIPKENIKAWGIKDIMKHYNITIDEDKKL